MRVEGTLMGYKVVITKQGKEKAIADVYSNGLVRVMCDVDLIKSFDPGGKISWEVETNNLVFASKAPAPIK